MVMPPKKERALMAIALFIIITCSMVSPLPFARNANASSGYYWRVGASSTDSSAVPNVGVRTVIDVIDQPGIMGPNQFVAPWIDDKLSNNMWIQMGYDSWYGYPKGFVEIWNLNTGSMIKQVYFPITAGPHTFSIYLKSGTLWGMTYDNTEITTYDAGTNISNSLQPVSTIVELYNTANTVFPFKTVYFPTAMEVIKSVGAQWTQVKTAYAKGSAYGVAGHLQNSTLADSQLMVGSSLPSLTSGTLVWQALSTTASSSTDTMLPTVSITSPLSGQIISLSDSTITGNANDNTGVARVEVLVDGSSWTVASGTTSWSLSLSDLSEGNHNVSARAIDSSGNISVIVSVAFAVSTISTSTTTTIAPDSTPPSVVIQNPKDGSTVKGTQTISVQATDNKGVTRIEIYIDGSLVSMSSSYSWNTKTVQNGSHTIVAKAFDASDNIGQSTINIVTQNKGKGF